MTSTFKVGTFGCGDEFVSPGFLGRAGLFAVFPTIFVLYLNDLPSGALSLIFSISSL